MNFRKFFDLRHHRFELQVVVVAVMLSGCANTPQGRQQQADYIANQMAVAGVRAAANIAAAGILKAGHLHPQYHHDQQPVRQAPAWLFRVRRGEVCVTNPLYTVCGEQGVRQFCSRNDVRCSW